MKKKLILLCTIILLLFPINSKVSSNENENNTIKIGMQLEPPNLNPTGGAAAATDEIVYLNIFEGLTKFKEDGSIVPALAYKWDIDKSGLIYKFFINNNVKFHDGKQMNAFDVEFSLNRARGENSTNAQKPLFESIETIKVINPYLLEIKLKYPESNFLTNLAWGDAVIVSKNNITKIETNPIGTGPFKFFKWVKGDKVVLIKNKEYWGKEIFLEKAIFKFISDPNAAYASILSGGLDVFPVYPALENLSQFQLNPLFKVLIGSTEGETILAMNNKKYPLNQKRIRKALSHAIDRNEIIDGAMFGYGIPIGSHFPPHSEDYLDLTMNSNFDPELSKKIISELFPNEDLKLTLKLPPPSYARRSGEIIASQFRKVGVNIEINYIEWAQWLNDVFKNKDYDLTIVSHTEPFDINIYARPDYYFQYNNKDFQNLMKDIKLEMNIEKRKKLLQKAQIILSEDYVNAFLFQLPKTGVAKKKIEGLWKNSPTQANDLTKVFWTK